MLLTKAPPITRHDYEGMPEGPPYFQLIEGDLVLSPSPKTFHQEITLNIGWLLRQHLETHPIGEVFIAPLDVHLSDINVFQPDVVFVARRGRAAVTEHGIEGPPDLVVETLSPATASYDRGSKRKIYARAGVQELWLVDPETKTLQIYHLAKDVEKPIATHGANAVARSPSLRGLKIQTRLIFRSSARTRLRRRG